MLNGILCWDINGKFTIMYRRPILFLPAPLTPQNKLLARCILSKTHDVNLAAFTFNAILDAWLALIPA